MGAKQILKGVESGGDTEEEEEEGDGNSTMERD